MHATLSEKQSKFPRYNLKCRGKHDTTRNILRSITPSPLHFMLYRLKSITFGTVQNAAGPIMTLQLIAEPVEADTTTKGKSQEDSKMFSLARKDDIQKLPPLEDNEVTLQQTEPTTTQTTEK